MAGRTRAAHKDGCMCAVCKGIRAKMEAPVEPEIIAPPPPPTEVRLDSVPSAAKFELGGKEYRVGEKFEGMVVCYNLFVNETLTFVGSTKVKPVE